MSRKYNTIANEFAVAVRESADNTNELRGAWRVINTYCSIEKRTNPRFDIDRFCEYIAERAFPVGRPAQKQATSIGFQPMMMFGGSK